MKKLKYTILGDEAIVTNLHEKITYFGVWILPL